MWIRASAGADRLLDRSKAVLVFLPMARGSRYPLIRAVMELFP